MGLLNRFRQGRADGAGDRPAAAPETAPADLPDPPRAPEPSSRAEQVEELEESAREMVAPAFSTRDEVEDSLVELYALDDDYDLTEDDVHQVLRRVWQERLDEEATWADEGDYRRLEAAFGFLDRSGIVARMNFACCQNCGHAEIGDERVEDSRGYVFFHQQDTERLAPGGSDLFLAFGGFGEAPGLDASLVGAEVAGALRGQGLTVEWDGTSAQRIRVTGLDWRKRLPVS